VRAYPWDKIESTLRLSGDLFAAAETAPTPQPAATESAEAIHGRTAVRGPPRRLPSVPANFATRWGA